MNLALLLKKFAYSISFLNPGVSALDRPEDMPLWVAIITCLLILSVIGLGVLVVYAYLS